MKLTKLFLAAGASLLLFAACSNDKSENKVKTIADYGNLTTADSLLYYFGQLRAVDYWYFAKNDSNLLSRQSRDEYLKGLRAGLDASRDDDAYNQGLYVGVQLAMNMKEFADEYGVDVNRKIIYDAIADGLANDSAVDYNEANNLFRQILNQMNARKEKADQETASAALSEASKAGKWDKFNDELYGGLIKTPGTGDLLSMGDFASVSVEINDKDGKELDRRQSERAEIGKSFPGIVTEALYKMKVGETRTFYTSAHTMFGRLISRYKLQPAQIISFTVSVNPPAPPKESEAAE